MDANRQTIIVGCLIVPLIFLAVGIFAMVYSNYSDEQTKRELMTVAEAETHTRFPNANEINAYQVEMSKGVETFSSLGIDRATVHVSMKIGSNTVRKYLWFSRDKGDVWRLTDIRE